MLTSELQKEIDEKWEACWPISLLKPVAILDLISYLFFINKISENHVISEETANKPHRGLFHSKEGGVETAAFSEPEAGGMHALFTSEKGSIDLIRNYARSLAFGAFVKGSLLVTPTQKLLANAVAILKIIEEAEEDKKGAIFEYLLGKKELSGPNGQAYLTEYLVNLIVSIVKPNDRDFILDASAGNGSLLVASAKYIASKNFKLNSPDSRRLTGLESDLTSLRITGMNMILHGINNPELKVLDTFSGLGFLNIEKPTVIVANLIFSGDETRMIVQGASIKETARKEILYLNFIIKNANAGTRIVAIVPDAVLYNNAAEFLATRQEIMDRFKVEAVISLNDKTIPQFFGSSMLVFSKETPAIGGKVWFYKMEHCTGLAKDENVASGSNAQNDREEILKQTGELEDILNHFRDDDDGKKIESPDSFYIDARDIMAKNYSLSYSEYSLFVDQQNAIDLSETTSSEKKVAIANLRNQIQFPAAELLPEPKKSYRKKIIFIACLSLLVLGTGFGAYWFLYLKKDFLTLKKNDITPVAIINSSQPDTTSIVVPHATSDLKPDTVSLIGKSSAVKTPDVVRKNKEQYTVVSDRAYFYNAPDTSTRRAVYINNLVHAVLTPEREKNAFIYVVYINKRGESTRGWLNKNDLKPLP